VIMVVDEKTYELHKVDRALVELLSAALVDPQLHGEVHARLRHEISGLLQIAYDDLYGNPGTHAEEPIVVTRGHELPSLLEAVLVDLNLHTDMRAHIHQKIEELLTDARADDLQ